MILISVWFKWVVFYRCYMVFMFDTDSSIWKMSEVFFIETRLNNFFKIIQYLIHTYHEIFCVSCIFAYTFRFWCHSRIRYETTMMAYSPKKFSYQNTNTQYQKKGRANRLTDEFIKSFHQHDTGIFSSSALNVNGFRHWLLDKMIWTIMFSCFWNDRYYWAHSTWMDTILLIDDFFSHKTLFNLIHHSFKKKQCWYPNGCHQTYEKYFRHKANKITFIKQ